MPTTNINVRIDSEIKSQAQDVLAFLGLDMTTAINIFLRQTIQRRAIPFAIADVSAKKTPKIGGWEGQIWIADDFNAPIDDFEEYMQ